MFCKREALLLLLLRLLRVMRDQTFETKIVYCFA
jgi:hypothetical protein